MRIFCAFIRDILERKKMEGGLRESEIYLQGILDSTNDGILAINNNGKIINSNNRFAELWHIPQELIGQKDDNVLLSYVLNQLVDPEGFISKVQELYKSDRTYFDMIHFKDGRIFERYSAPLILIKNIVGRVWSFRDITVKDNGIGISEKHVTKIFDMFYRASENSKGSGLGLYIAKETITKLGGTIKVQSEFGISTTFEITIPNSTPN